MYKIERELCRYINATSFSCQMNDIDMVKSEVRQQGSVIMVTRQTIVTPVLAVYRPAQFRQMGKS